MTDKTTRIWVELTDEQMDYIDNNWGYMGSSHRTMGTIRDAVKAQRPRPIAVGDRVQVTDHDVSYLYQVKAIDNGWAWLWQNGQPVGAWRLDRLTRVDDETTT